MQQSFWPSFRFTSFGMQALLHVSQVPHMTGQFSLTSWPMTMSLHFPPYSERHWAGSILPLQVGVVAVVVVAMVVGHGFGPV